MNKRLSIITINLNDADGLRQTIQSVVKQKSANFEYIIIDGNSGDKSKEVINEFKDAIDCAISEPDTGIYNAMNKGLAKATGEYILFLNSGDVLLDNNGLQQLLDKGNNADIVYGDIIFSDDKTQRECIFPDKLTFNFFLLNSLPHPSTIVRKKLYNALGGFFEHLKVTADWAFFLLAINKYNYTWKHVSFFISNFRLGGISSTEADIIASERKDILEAHFPMFLDDYKKQQEVLTKLTIAQMQWGYRLHNKFKKIIKPF